MNVHVHVHVEHLVLEGLPLEAGHGDRVRAAAEAELTRLLASGPAPGGLRRGGARARAAAEDIAVSGNETPEALGRLIGRAVHGGMGR